MKHVLIELSKEHPTLPTAEAHAVLQAERIPYTTIWETPGLLHITTPQENIDHLKNLAQRLALSFHINELLFSSPPTIPGLLQEAKTHALPPHTSFRIRCIKKTRMPTVKTMTIEQKLGETYAHGNPVDLHTPDLKIRVLLTPEKWYTTIHRATINRSQYEQRKVHQRPFFSPISLHPRLARTLVNLAHLQKGETLLDPFCGTGGILLEAGLIGVNIIGSDIQDEMTHGCKQTLNHYHITDHTLINCDVAELPHHIDQKVDAIVTDFPYGKSTTTKGEQLSSIHHRAFTTFTQLVKPHKHIVIGVSEHTAIKTAQQYLTHVETHPYRVHRSLTRYFAVFKNE